MRTNQIRLSDDEKNQLEQYKNAAYGSEVPFGFVVGQLLNEVKDD